MTFELLSQDSGFLFAILKDVGFVYRSKTKAAVHFRTAALFYLGSFKDCLITSCRPCHRPLEAYLHQLFHLLDRQLVHTR